MTPIELTRHMAREAQARGWHAFIVGGWVRDRVIGASSKDIDVEMFGPTSLQDLISFARRFASVDLVGESFAVLKVKVPGHTAIDLSLPRTEHKTGMGHRAFNIMADGTLSLRAASERRDFTFNSMFFDPLTEQIIDPHGGIADLRHHRLRHTSAQFSKDPLRVLRGAQQCARFNLTADPSTVALCRTLKSEFSTLPVERVWEEWHKLMTRCVKPSRGLIFLHRTGWIDFFSPLNQLLRLPQEARFHPEGSAWQHTKQCVDRACALGADEPTMFAALLHDIGKPLTTERHGNRISSIRHDKIGSGIAMEWMSKIGAPRKMCTTVSNLVKEHMVFTNHTHVSHSAVRRLAQRLSPATVSQLITLVRADLTSRGPSNKDTKFLNAVCDIAEENHVIDSQPEPIIMGRHLIELGLKPSPQFSTILSEVFERQINGDFSTLADGLQITKEVIEKGQ
jgi:tRNA nucleotidyltransferase (CCA-adding enzyme)